MSNELALIDSLFLTDGNKEYYPFDVVFHPTKGMGVVLYVEDSTAKIYYIREESMGTQFVGNVIIRGREREKVKRIGNIVELLVMKLEGDELPNISTSLLMDLIEGLQFIPEEKRKMLREKFIWERDKQVHPHKYDCQGNMIEDKQALAVSNEFVCECGAVLNECSSDWRCAGSYWGHYHGYPIGHVPVFSSKGKLNVQS